MILPAVFTRLPLAHRGLHDRALPENTLAAIEAAVDAGYGIEIDVQPAAGSVPMVFHDYDLTRLAGDEGFIADMEADDLEAVGLNNTDHGIPTLAAALRVVDGRAPLLIEMKDQDGRLGDQIGELHRHVIDALQAYDGPVAVMSFNPHMVSAFHAEAPQIPCGLTTCGFAEDNWPMLDEETRDRMAALTDFDQSGAVFISHDKGDLDNPRVDALKAQGVPVLCWTVRSEAEESAAREIAENITFEGYRPQIPE
ncbi:glycerophosphodiester phosphodiesterase family protein [Paracoccus tegillarcae]|uniref:Phosphodiesterase n=1 Tax=Paracoccus tegillarcae TaxID=1529068 RepID=A0A2K9F034_9RHOB|nr:glycerophosphodiester phosphodiesterase family protein [Paracoccus tegillarcae]AUH33712.1 phosphodiesterase [Paracoccus tegillarcae]